MTDTVNGYIAIGDIHGCAKTLKVLLERLDREFGTSRTYVFLGDYVDRGPDSKGVVETLIAFERTHPCVFLRGNHDAMLLSSHQGNFMLDWFDNGGDATMESYQHGDPEKKIPRNHIEFFINTRLFLDTERWLFVHGGIPTNISVAEAIADESLYSSFLWRRDHIGTTETKWEKTVIFGHTPVRTPITAESMIGIDTGCVYENYGKLTAVILPENEFIQQSRIDF